ncbi:hypothetical protein PR003_g11326, partial [Phytophthora rubi]
MGRRRPRRTWPAAPKGLKMLWATLLLLAAVAAAEFFTPEDVPGPPEKVLVWPASASSVRVQFSPPLGVKPEG